MKKFGILMIAILLTASVCFTSCSLFSKGSEESETESVGSSETESESGSTESDSTEELSETESATDGNDGSDTVKFIDPSKDAYADDIYTPIEPEEIG